MVHTRVQPREVPTHQIKLYVVQRASAGGGTKRHISPGKSKRLGNAGREVKNPCNQINAGNLFLGLGRYISGNCKKSRNVQRLIAEGQRDGINIRIDFERQRLILKVEEVPIPVQTLLGMLGGIVIGAGSATPRTLHLPFSCD